MSPAPTKVENLTFEAAFAELEAIVAALEGEGRPLNESIQMYERGQALSAHCASLLEKATLKVRTLGAPADEDLEGQA